MSESEKPLSPVIENLIKWATKHYDIDPIVTLKSIEEKNPEGLHQLVLTALRYHSDDPNGNDNLDLIDQIFVKFPEILKHVNEIGNSYFMIAAETGHLKLVEGLADFERITRTNNYRQSAFILAIERDHLPILRFLHKKFPSEYNFTFKNEKDEDAQLTATLLTQENKYSKSSLFVACEFAKADIVEWLLNECHLDPLKANTRGVFPLMYACAGPMSDSRLKVVDLLIAKNPDCVNCVNSSNETVLHWAAIQGHWEIIKRVFESRHFNFSLINNISGVKFGDGRTALLRAVYSGDEECVELLISHGADFHIPSVPKNPAEEKPQDAFQMAWLQGFPKIATKFFMLVDPKECNESFRKYSLIKNLDLKLDDLKTANVFFELEIQLIAKRLANTNNISHLQDLVHYAGIYEFHFNLFIDIVFPMFTSPNIALNKTIDFFFSSLQHRHHSHVQLVSHLVRLAAALTTAIEEHPLEQTDLKKRLDIVESMLTECVSCDSMDDRKNIELVMCSDNKEFYENRIVQYSQAFLSGPVRTCLDFHITSIFSTANLSLFIDEIFWSYLKRSDERDFQIIDIQKFLLKPFDIQELAESKKIRNLQSNLIHGRYCPAFMLFAEGASKAFFLFLISATSMALYSPGVEGTSPILEVLKLKRAIYVFLFTLFWYEIGQLCNHTTQILPTKKSIAGYFNEVWNYLDMFGIILVMLWIGSRQHYDHTLSGLLPTAAVFYACSLLRYLSVHEELGKLVIMIFAMSADLAVFGIVYLICVAGFTVAIWALFSGVDGLHSFMDVFLFLCSITMGNTPFDAFSGSPYNSIGMTLVFCFLVFTGIILINLVIARMSATHDRINETSFQEWQFDRATTTDSFILIEERHPFCMLPAPLNLLTMAVTPLHWLMIYLHTPCNQPSQVENTPGLSSSQHASTHLSSSNHGNTLQKHEYPFPSLISGSHENFPSIAGTTSDLLLGCIMSFIAPVIELVVYDYNLIRKGKIFPSEGFPLFRLLRSLCCATPKDSFKQGTDFYIYFLEFLLINVCFPVIYPFYVLTLIRETVQLRTTLCYEEHNGNPIFRVNYKLREHYPLPDPKDWTEKDDDLILNIKVLRCADLAYSDTSGQKTTKPVENPVLKFRFGRVEISTPESVNGTKNPNWPNCVLQIPKSEIDKSHGKKVEEVKFIDIAVYDRDQVTGKETLVLEKKQAIDLNQLFSTGRLEGDVNLGPVPFDPKSSPRMSLAAIVLNRSDFIKQNSEENEQDSPDDDDDDDDEGVSLSMINPQINSKVNKPTIPNEHKILRRMKAKMDVIFETDDLKNIFRDVDTLQDSDYERDYKVSCQRSLELFKNALKQFQHFKNIEKNQFSSQPQKEVAKWSLLLHLEEFLQAFKKAEEFLVESDPVGVSGPFHFSMEKYRLESLITLTSLDFCEGALDQILEVLERMHQDLSWEAHTKKFFKPLRKYHTRCLFLHNGAVEDLRDLLLLPIPDSNVSLSLRSETPEIKFFKAKIQTLEDETRYAFKRVNSASLIHKRMNRVSRFLHQPTSASFLPPLESVREQQEGSSETTPDSSDRLVLSLLQATSSSNPTFPLTPPSST